MPSKQRHFCGHPGCPELVRGRPYCSAHTPPDSRPSPSARGYNWTWRKIRAAYLAEHPRCERCGTESVEVHHKDGDTSNNEWWNLEALCKPCHSRETRTRMNENG